MSWVPIAIENLIKARSMLGTNAPSVKVTLTEKSSRINFPETDWQLLDRCYLGDDDDQGRLTSLIHNTADGCHYILANTNNSGALILKFTPGTQALTVASEKVLALHQHDIAIYNGSIFCTLGISNGTYICYLYELVDGVLVRRIDDPTYAPKTLCVFNGHLYSTSSGWFGGTTYGSCELLEYNDIDGWTVKAAGIGQYYTTLYVFNNKLYTVGATTGKLYEWNGTDAWVQKAAVLGSYQYLDRLMEHDGYLYAIAYSNGPSLLGGSLLKWNGTNAWAEIFAYNNYLPDNIPSVDGTYSDGTDLFILTGGDAGLWRANFSTNQWDSMVTTATYYGSQQSPGRFRNLIYVNDMFITGCTMTDPIDGYGYLLYVPAPGTNLIKPTSVRLSKEEAANAQACTIEFPNVNPTDPTDAGYYSPYRSGSDFPAKTENDWRNEILPSKQVIVEAGYGAELATVFTGTIDRVSHYTLPRSAMLRLECRDYGWRLVDKTIIAEVDGADAYYIDYPIDAATTAVWLTTDMFVIMPRGNRMVFTSDQGGPVSIELDHDTYTGVTLATELETKMNANATLTGGAITFDVAWNGITRIFTIDAGVGHTIAYTNTGSTAGTMFGMTEDVAAAQSIESVEAYTAAIEMIVKDLLVRAGFAAADVTIEPTYMLLDPTFERMSYGDAIEEMCTLSGFELVIDEYGKPEFRFPSDRQPETYDQAWLTGTTWVYLSTFPIVTATIVVSSEEEKAGIIYTVDVDYKVEAGTVSTPWRIRRLVGGSIGSGQWVYVTYVYAAWIFTEGQDIFRLDLSISRQDLYGKIVVEGDTCSGLYETATPRWDGSTVTTDRVMFVLDENLDTDEKCQKVANRLGGEMLARVIGCEFAAVAIPWLQVGDCVQIIESSSTISEIYRITSMDFDFSPMNHIMTFKAYHYGYAPL